MSRSSGVPPPDSHDHFYGYPPEMIRDVCAVSLGTAREYKAGRQSPSSPALKLWNLFVQGRIVPASWNQYAFNPKGQLCQRQTNFWVDEAALNGFTYRMQLLPRPQQRTKELESRVNELEVELAERSRHYLLVDSLVQGSHLGSSTTQSARKKA
jgi:hypothetical protein